MKKRPLLLLPLKMLIASICCLPKRMKCCWLGLMVLAVFFTTGCTKTTSPSGPTSVQGVIISTHNQEAIPDAEVWVVEKKYGSWTAMYNRTIVQGFTNANGLFSLDFEAQPDHHYDLFARAPHYQTWASGMSLDAGEKNYKVMELEGRGFVRFIVTNTSTPPDSLYYLRINGGCGQSIDLPRFTSDTTIVRSCMGDYKLSLVVLKQVSHEEPPSEEHHSIFLPALDTVDFHIEY